MHQRNPRIHSDHGLIGSLMYRDPNDLGSLILIEIIPKERTISFRSFLGAILINISYPKFANAPHLLNPLTLQQLIQHLSVEYKFIRWFLGYL